MSASREKRLRRELREAEAGSDTVKKAKKQKKPMTPRRAKRIRSIVGNTVAIVLVLAFALLIFVNSGFLQTHATAAQVGSHSLTPAEFDYFYQDTYNNIKSTYTSYGYWNYMVDTTKDIDSQEYADGTTWRQYIQETALTNATQIYTLYDAALADGMTLEEDAQSTIDALPDTLESAAKQADYADAADYLEEYYGKGASLDTYVAYATAQEYASQYSQEKTDSFTYTDEELRAYYNDNRQDFDKVTYRVFDVATQDDDSAAAKDTADAMAAELDGTEAGFADAARKYAPEDQTESYEDDSYTLRSNASYSSISSDYADWLFGDGRTAGESQVFATSSGYSVVMFVSRENNEYNTVNVRHILIQVDTSGEDGESTDADWDACKEEIDKITQEWEDSDKTEETFASMAEEHSEDTGSASNGGLYEDVYKGQMVTEFNDWCFDPARKVGDYGVVKTTYGYHLIYFSGLGEEYWKSLADSSKRSADYQSWYEEASAKYAGETKWFGMLFTNRDLEA